MITDALAFNFPLGNSSECQQCTYRKYFNLTFTHPVLLHSVIPVMYNVMYIQLKLDHLSGKVVLLGSE